MIRHGCRVATVVGKVADTYDSGMAVRSKRGDVRRDAAAPASGGPPDIPDPPGTVTPPDPTPPTGRPWSPPPLLGFALVLLLTVMVVGAAFKLREPLTVVRVASSLPYLEDPEVRRILRDEGLKVNQTGFGTRQAAQYVDLSTYDLVVSGSAVQARLVEKQLTPDVAKRRWFSSPMVVVTRPPIVKLLERVGIAEPAAGGGWQFSVAAYLREVESGRRWKEIVGDDGAPLRGQDGDAAYPSPIRMLVSTTDPDLSNSAAMFVAILSFHINDQNVVTEESVKGVLPRLKKCFVAQGNMAPRTADLMESFLDGGLPMALVYENDYLAARRKSVSAKSIIAMYPTSNVMSENTFTIRSEAGKRLSDLLFNDRRLQKLAQDWGYRAGATAANPAATIPMPTTAVLEKLIDGVGP